MTFHAVSDSGAQCGASLTRKNKVGNEKLNREGSGEQRVSPTIAPRANQVSDFRSLGNILSAS